MGVIQKLATALRGGTREVLELAVDANGLRIFAQEIHDGETAIRQAKTDLCRLSAERIRLQREADQLYSKVKEREHQAAVALDQGNESLALEAAQWIADNEPLLIDLRDKQQQLEGQEQNLTRELQQVIRQIEQYRREFKMVQATGSAQSATEKIANQSNALPGHLDQMGSSLNRIRQWQQQFSDRMAAAASVEANLSNQALELRLAAMEPGASPGSAAAVLERIRQQQRTE